MESTAAVETLTLHGGSAASPPSAEKEGPVGDLDFVVVVFLVKP